MGNDFYFHQGSNSSWSVCSRDFPFPFFAGLCCSVSYLFPSFFARNLKDELYLVGGGVLGGSLFFFLQNIALGLTQASNVSFIICMAPLLTAVLTVLSVRTEKVSRGFIYGSIIALLGVGLLIFNGSFILRISPLGDLLTLLASLSWAFYSLVIRSLTRKYSPAFITRKIFFYGIITILPTFLFLPSLTNPAVLLDNEVWSNLLFLGVIASSACYLLWNIVVLLPMRDRAMSLSFDRKLWMRCYRYRQILSRKST